MKERLRMIISGRVQGVFYRRSVFERALKLGLEGWVHNLDGGDVEVVAEGERASLNKLMSWCWEGPPGAHVENIESSWLKAENVVGFKINYS